MTLSMQIACHIMPRDRCSRALNAQKLKLALTQRDTFLRLRGFSHGNVAELIHPGLCWMQAVLSCYDICFLQTKDGLLLAWSLFRALAMAFLLFSLSISKAKVPFCCKVSICSHFLFLVRQSATIVWFPATLLGWRHLLVHDPIEWVAVFFTRLAP